MTSATENRSPWPTFEILGATITALDQKALLTVIAERIARGQGGVLGVYNLHALYLVRRSPAMHRFYSRTTLNLIDGMSLILLGRLSGLPVRRTHRVAYPDVFPRLLTQAQRNRWKVYYVGGRPGVAERAVERLLGRTDSIELRSHHGDFDLDPASDSSRWLIEDICSFQPDLLLVGLGMPRQETWVLEHLERLEGIVVLTCGATVEYFSGDQRLPPRWLGAIGLEWAYRLLSDPRRLWRRYLFEPLTLAPGIAVEVARRRWRRSFRAGSSRKAGQH